MPRLGGLREGNPVDLEVDRQPGVLDLLGGVLLQARAIGARVGGEALPGGVEVSALAGRVAEGRPRGAPQLGRAGVQRGELTKRMKIVSMTSARKRQKAFPSGPG